MAPQRPPQRPDDRPSVVVPPDLAGGLLWLLVRALKREVRDDGGIIPPGLEPFLRDLHEAAEAAPVADDGNVEQTPGTIDVMAMVTVAQLSATSGHPHRTLRHWAATGRIRAHRAGRTWLIDPDSLTSRK